MASFWGHFKWPRHSTRDDELEKVSALVDNLLAQNRECLMVIKEQQAVISKATEVLSKFNDVMTDHESANFGDVTYII
ncbi:hypothetical protein MCP_1497 [Methanocella paludicola SANAE]|uniref:Uncharacterized protein n=1 Tax=Methanocella paludicola (strain DSM 17711 / JCM 13418 / NBRC 101707 / SANAE) TaxID=304371 RepID=D1YYP7_METPS|nr:hypothetical protein MCP_1497 [Methanocella paludicola SANAE]